MCWYELHLAIISRVLSLPSTHTHACKGHGCVTYTLTQRNPMWHIYLCYFLLAHTHTHWHTRTRATNRRCAGILTSCISPHGAGEERSHAVRTRPTKQQRARPPPHTHIHTHCTDTHRQNHTHTATNKAARHRPVYILIPIYIYK